MKLKIPLIYVAIFVAVFNVRAQLQFCSSTNLPSGAVGKSYSTTICADGGVNPYTWYVSGNYPPWADPPPGISGTPTTATTYHFTIIVQDHAYQYISNVFNLTINPQLLPSVQTLAASSIGVNSAILNASVNPNGAATTIYFQYGLTTSYGSTSSSQNIGTTSGNYGIPVSGLSANQIYHFQAVAYNSGGTNNGNDLTFQTSPQPAPTVTTLAASSITTNSVVLNFSVNPNGAGTTVYFEYGPTTNYGSTTFSLTGITTSQSDGITASSLSPGTLYHFQAVAYNSGGTSYGGDLVFTTSPASQQQPPTVTTSAASSITTNSAVLNFSVNPNGAGTTVYFEYGPTTNYGSTTFSLTGITTSQSDGITASSLSPGTPYHFQAVAYNSGGTSYGGDLTFTTASPSTPPVAIATPCINGLQVEINGAPVPPNPATLTNVSWNWGDGQQNFQWSPASHIYSSAGQYNVLMTACFNDGSTESATGSVFVAQGVLSGCDALTISAGQGGSVSYQASIGTNIVPEGGSVTLQSCYGGDFFLTANPDFASSFANWSASAGVSQWGQQGLSEWIAIGSNSQITANFSSFSINFPPNSVLYVENNDNSTGINTILELNSTGNIVRSISSSLFNALYANLVFDGNGNLYVANYSIGTILKVSPGGSVSTFATGFNEPSGLSFDGNGNLYVANWAGGTVSMVTPAGNVSTFATGLAGPNGLAFDSSGNLYVSSSGVGVVYKIAPAGRVSTFASGFNWPAGLVFDNSGNLYVANQDGLSILKVTPNGNVSTFVSGIQQPLGMVFDSNGNLYVTSFVPNGLISVVTPNGQLSTFVTGLNWPGGLAIGPEVTLLPAVVTGSANSITANSATLNGSVNPNGSATTAWFQYGTSTNYGYTTSSQSVGSDTSKRSVYSPTVSGLNPNTTYHFRVVASSGAGTACGTDTNFTTLPGETPPLVISSTYSTLILTPTSAPTDGSSQITVTATLRDTSNNSVTNRTVQFVATGQAAVKLANSMVTSDSNGIATTTITASTPGTSTICLIDPANLNIIASAVATFTQQLVPLTIDLQNAVEFLGGSSSGILSVGNNSIANLSTNEGAIGDYFLQKEGGQITKTVMDTIFSAASFRLGIAGVSEDGASALENGAESIIHGALKDGTASIIMNSLEAVIPLLPDFENSAQNSAGLTTLGQTNAEICATFQQDLQTQEGLLISGVTPESDALSDSYTNDLALRLVANEVLWQVLTNQDLFLQKIYQASRNNEDDWVGPFLLQLGEDGSIIVVSAAVGSVDPAAGFAVGVTLNTAATANNLLDDYNGFSGYRNAYFQALSSQMECINLYGQVFQNTSAAFTEVSRHITPSPITATIVSVSTSETGPEYIYQYQGSSGVTSGTVVQTLDRPTSASTTITLKNASGQSAYFQAFAFYTYSDSTFGAYYPDMPMVVTGGILLNNQAFGQIQLQYYDGNHGSYPTPQTAITIYVLGTTTELSQHSYGTFLIGTQSSEAIFTPTSIIMQGVTALSQSKRYSPADDPSSTNAVITANPIRTYIAQNAGDQNYQTEIWVSNPFDVPLTATVTQALPTGIDIVDTDGMITGSSIVWTNLIAPSNSVENTFTFSFSPTPGGPTNLPQPTVVFTDSTGTNSLSLESVVANFDGLFPVQVSGSIPAGVLGVVSTMTVMVTNLTGTNQTGSLTIALTDSSGNSVTNLSESFSLDGSGGTNLSFALPGFLSPGSYMLTGSLAINGGSGQVLAGNYVVPAPPMALNLASTPALTTNGFNLALQGPAGNYLIESSSDLFSATNWQPILFYSSTNASFIYNFTIPLAQGVNQQFYRAVKQ